MRYELGHKEQTRTKMIGTAARVLRRDGIAAAGVAGLMAEAGLTNGAFYAHFESKEALVAQAIVAALHETTAAIAAAIEGAAPGRQLDALVAHYLDPRHVAHPEHGCAVAALGSELARRPESSRILIDKAIEGLIAAIARALPAGHANRMAAARAVFASLVGTIQLARASRPSLTAPILKAGAAAAHRLGQPSKHQGADSE